MKKVHSQLCHLNDDKAIILLKELCSSVEDATECLAIHIRQIELHSLCADGKFCIQFQFSVCFKVSFSILSRFVKTFG